MTKAKVLVYTSSATQVPHREGGGHKVGVFLGELVEPLEPLIDAGHELVFVSPDGRACTIDENSFKLSYWKFSRRRLEHAKHYWNKLKALGLERPIKLSELLADEKNLESYHALFIPGGHAPMTDVLHKNWMESSDINEETGRLLLHFHQRQKPTSLICHASAALAAAPSVDGQWIYSGYQMTCVSMLAEKLVEDMPVFNAGGHMPDYPVPMLERKGGIVKNVFLGRSLVVDDRELMTGQDPYAAEELGQKLLKKIEQYLATTIL